MPFLFGGEARQMPPLRRHWSSKHGEKNRLLHRRLYTTQQVSKIPISSLQQWIIMTIFCLFVYLYRLFQRKLVMSVSYVSLFFLSMLTHCVVFTHSTRANLFFCDCQRTPSSSPPHQWKSNPSDNHTVQCSHYG